MAEQITLTTAEYIAMLIAHEREVREASVAAVEKARATQFDEYQRRLDDLNHAHEQARESARNTVPRETFDNYVRESDVQLKLALAAADLKVEAAMKEIETERQARIRLEGSMSTWRGIAVFLGLPGIVALLIGLFTVFAP